MSNDKKILMGQEITKEQFLQMKEMMAESGGGMMDALQGAFGGDEESTEIRYSEVPAPVNVDEAALTKGFENIRFGYAESWFDSVKVEVDLFSLPNSESVRAGIDWEGEVPSTEGKEPRFDAKTGVLSIDIPCEKDKADELISRLKGSLSVSAGASFRKVGFTSDQTGKEAEGWTLKKMEGGSISLGAPDNADDAVIVALDEAGRRLDWSSRQSGTAHKDGRNMWELEWDELKEADFVQEAQFSFCGDVAEVHIYVPEKRVSGKSALTVVKKWTSGDVVEGTRFARPRDVDFREMSEDEIRSAISVSFARNQAMIGKGQPTARVQLPKCDNSVYSAISFGDFTVEGASAFEVEGGGLDCRSYTVERRLTNDEDENALAGVTRMRGEATVRYPRKIEILRVNREKGTDESGRIRVEIEGSGVTFHWKPETLPGLSEDMASFAPTPLDRFTALHESGNRLEKLPSTGMGSGSDGAWVKLMFWGEPSEFEIRHPVDFVDIKVPIDLVVPS